jgi:hypothetical protein
MTQIRVYESTNIPLTIAQYEKQLFITYAYITELTLLYNSHAAQLHLGSAW